MSNSATGGTAAQAMQEGAARLERAGVESARLDARLLLARALNTDRLGVFREPERILNAGEAAQWESDLARREAREPLAYILGVKEFHGLEFAVDRAVLIPRPETELLVGLALAYADSHARHIPDPLCADIGTGSGAIAVAASHARPRSRWVATDVSAEALAVARANAVRHGLTTRIEFRLGSLCEPLKETFDAIFSNPPYVREGEMAGLAPELREWEPHGALASGADGLDAIRGLVAQAPAKLKPGGLFAVEIGFDQADAVTALVNAAGTFEKAETLHDLAGLPRCIAALRK